MTVETYDLAVDQAIAGGHALFISASGNDAWSGRAPAAAAAGGNGPLATLEAAIELARGDFGIKTILVEDGDYHLPRAVRLGAADAGLTIAAAPGATPVLHGGLDLAAAQWTPVGDGVYAATVDVAGLPRGVVDLHVGGERQTAARFPNAVAGEPAEGWLFAAPGTSGHEAIRFRPGDVPEGIDTGQLRVLVTDNAQWTSNTARVESIDYEAGIIHLADNVPWHQLGEGSRYYLFDSQAALDQPGEWYFDAATATLYLKPLDPAVLGDGTAIVAATTDSLIEIEGTSDITIAGLTLRDGSPNGSDRSFDYVQIGGGAIKVVDASGVVIADNHIANVGVGINLLDVEGAAIAGNTIEHVAGNGIFLGMPWGGDGSRNVTIEGNTVRDVGHTFIEAAGIWFQGTADSVISHNVIEQAAQFGIMGAQTRDTFEDRILDNTIAHNVVRDANYLTADGGGIKLYAAKPGGAVGNDIAFNWIDGATHLMSRPDGTIFAADDWSDSRWPQPISAGLYLDWNISETEMVGNLVTDSYGGILIVNSNDNSMRGNVVAGGQGAAFEVVEQPMDGRSQMAGNLFAGNVAIRDGANAAGAKIYDPTGGPAPARFESNVYFGEAIDGDGFVVQGRGWLGDLRGDVEAWIAQGYAATDEHELDPGFVDPANLDFTLRPDSPLPGLGISVLDESLLALIDAVTGQPEPRPNPEPEPAPTPQPQPEPDHGALDGAQVTVVASGDSWLDQWGVGPAPEFFLMIDGEAIGEAVKVTADHAQGEWQTLSFTLDAPASAIGTLGIFYHNDGGTYDAARGGWVAGEDRNLYIREVSVDSRVLEPADGAWLPHWGAVDPGRGDLVSRGTLSFDLATAEPAPPPAPEPASQPEPTPDPAPAPQSESTPEPDQGPIAQWKSLFVKSPWPGLSTGDFSALTSLDIKQALDVAKADLKPGPRGPDARSLLLGDLIDEAPDLLAQGQDPGKGGGDHGASSSFVMDLDTLGANVDPNYNL